MIKLEDIQNILKAGDLMVLDTETMKYRDVSVVSVIMNLINSQLPRWVYDRLPEKDDTTRFRCKLKDNYGSVYEAVHPYDGLFYFRMHNMLICWLWHLEPIDENNPGGSEEQGNKENAK